MHLPPVLELTIRLAFFALFALALVHKLFRWHEFQATVASYIGFHGVTNGPLAKAVAVLVVIAESAVLVLCAWSQNAALCAYVITGTLLAYATAMLANKLAGNDILDCGCSWGRARIPIGYGLILRNGLLSLLACLLVIPVESRPLDTVEIVMSIMAALTGAVLYAALHELPASQPMVRIAQ